MFSKFMTLVAYLLPSVASYLADSKYTVPAAIVGTIAVAIGHGVQPPAFLNKAGVEK